MPFPVIAQPLPRAGDAYTTLDKWHGWILAKSGHAEEWQDVFRVGRPDIGRVWAAIAVAVQDGLVSSVRDRSPHGVVCGVDVVLTINDRTSQVATAWHYADAEAAPRLVTAYPRPNITPWR
jgi:hypothetical protein